MQNSSRDSSDDSSDASDGSSNASATVLGAVLVGAGMVALGIALTNNTVADDAAARVDRFLKRYHAMIARDLVLAQGPTLEALTRDLGLSAKERAQVRRALEGSKEQTQLLEALAAPSKQQPRRFSSSFRRLILRAVGEARLQRAQQEALRRLAAS